MREFILGYLLNAAWEAPLIAAGALLLPRLAKLDARERCWMGIGLLALAVLLPALDPRLAASFTPPALPQSVSYAVNPDLQTAASPPTTMQPQAADLSLAPATANPLPTATALTAPGRITLAPMVVLGLLGAFLAAVAVGVVRLAVGLFSAGRLLRRSHEIELPAAVLAPMRRLATAHGRKAIPVRASEDLTVPAAVGGWTPTILVPSDFARHGEEAMTAALLHECAHVVRGDYAINLACEALTLPLIWHPAVHLIKSQVQADRETACDRLAASQMPAKRYASCLVALADAMSPPRTALVMQTLFGRGELERRVRVLLQAPLAEGRLLRAALMGGPALAAVVASGLVFHVEPAMARAQPSTPAAVQSSPLPPASPSPPAPVSTPSEPVPAAAPHNVERHVHRWTTDDGKTHMVVVESDRDLTPEERAKLDAEIGKAKEDAAKARAYVHSPEFHKTIIKAEREASSAAIAQAKADADAMKAEALANRDELRAHVHDMVAHQKILITVDQAEMNAKMRRVEEILRDPEIQKALAQARAAGPEVRRALDRLDRELEAANDKFPPPPRPPAPPAPPKPPAPPPPPPAPPPPPPPPEAQ